MFENLEISIDINDIEFPMKVKQTNGEYTWWWQ